MRLGGITPVSVKAQFQPGTCRTHTFGCEDRRVQERPRRQPRSKTPPAVSALACEFVLQASREVVQMRSVVVKPLQVRDDRGAVMRPSLQVRMRSLQLSVLGRQRIPLCLMFGSHARSTTMSVPES